MQVTRQNPIIPPIAMSFAEYIQTLPLWDRRLLQNVEITDVAGLIAHLRSDQPLFVVSDGGASDERGSFGALLATDDEIFVKLSGSTEGAAPGSFRAESYGCLAIFRLVYHFRQYHLIDSITCLHHFYCDNQGLITRLGYHS
jgi:hypothetical protein